MLHNRGTANMAPTLFRRETNQNPFTIKRNYGASAIENADELLKEEVQTLKLAHAQVASLLPSVPEAHAKLELQRSKDALIKARLRRQALEAELQEATGMESALEHKTELCSKRLENIRSMTKRDTGKERRRQAAFAQKSGAKAMGVKKKVLPASRMKFLGIRLAKRDGA
ncbi:hypothetical protein DE146DRAFT_438701 [Phaeosphaeria sp. MPI-PUGE-AT-0046c]|nr:hypothetical protein DE146DRAFT_438701 [Phaeosphaeria sp. MPI-PUGE-AT-0046c]